MIDPPVWTEAQLEADRRTAIERFREERIREPLRRYLDAFDRRQPYFADLVKWLLVDSDPDRVPDDTVLKVLTSEPHLEALRYLAAPPISADDLKVLAEADSLSEKALRRDLERARLVYRTVMQGLDPRRFPWVGQRTATEAETQAAVVASAALLASRRAETERRNEGKSTQEASVVAALDEIGWQRDEPRTIRTLDEAPAEGHYCGESMLGGRKADVVVRLGDRRVLAIECKVSNSATNSIKRLNNDAAVKAVQWLREFGVRQIIPSAMLSGVYKLRNLVDAQSSRLTLWWAHDLQQFQSWVQRAHR